MNSNPHSAADYFSEDELREAARIVAEAMLDSLPAPEACHHDVSPDFLSKMDSLLAKAKRRETARRWAGRAAAALLALVIGATSWLAVDTQARAAFFSWVREVYENSVVYRFFNDTSVVDQLPDYRPSWVPDGYVQTDVIEDDTVHSIIYENIANPDDSFVFDYQLYFDSMNLSLQWEDHECEILELQINGKTAHFYRSLDGSITNDLIWVDENTTILFTLTGYLEQDVMLHIAESIDLVN